jgi:NADH:ubiquinone oxidoreductase subunit 6 (chain J)
MLNYPLFIFFLLFIFVGLFILITNNPVHSILALFLIFFLSSCLILSIGAEFFAILILIVYIGAISVLFLFVVMLLNIRVLELNVSLLKYWWLGIIYSFFFFVNLFYAVLPIYGTVPADAPVYLNYTEVVFEWSSISQYGELIFIYFPHLLILASLILLLAIVSPVLLCYVSFNRSAPVSSKRVNSKRQDIFSQSLRLSVDVNFLD